MKQPDHLLTTPRHALSNGPQFAALQFEPARAISAISHEDQFEVPLVRHQDAAHFALVLLLPPKRAAMKSALLAG